jgi:hypothetical protein
VSAFTLALALQVAAAGEPRGYEALVARGVAEARAGRSTEGEALLRQALALDPARPEARAELGGLRFLEGRYAEAVTDLRAALRAGADAHARELLAASLHLGGRMDEALDEWNRLRRPVLRNLHLVGVHDTRSRLLVPQLAFAEGTLLTRDQVRETRLRLADTGAFQRVSVRTVPLPGGDADLELALLERRGLGSPPELVALISSRLAQRTAFLRYDNVDGAGVGVRASYRWQSTQPRAALGIHWPRPLGAGLTLRSEGWWERAHYDLLGGRLVMEANGAAVALGRVLGPRTRAELGWSGGRRTFTGAAPAPAAARDGRVSGLAVAAEHLLVDRWRHRLDASGSLLAAGRATGSSLGYTVGRLRLRHLAFLAPPTRTAIERSVLAAQLTVGRASTGAPLDALFAPGAGSEVEFPLRAHRQKRGGVLGAGPIGRSMTLLNVEWRFGRAVRGPVQMGGVFFADAVRMSGLATSPADRNFLDLGVGVRLAVLGVLIRADYGRGVLGPSTSAFTAGIGSLF